ncbi:TPA: hypothetical protein ACGUW8_004254 [Vibrio vulnificus]
MRNIDIFNLITAEVFAASYEQFPVEISIVSEDMAQSIANYFPQDLHEEVVKNARESVFSTVEWLGRSGYLYVKDQHDMGFGRVTLTPKALALLNQVPSSLQESIGSEMIKRAKEFSSIALIESVKLMFSNS